MTQTHYVLGFAFSPEGAAVLLIRKTKPRWQAGKLNGVGGHVEEFDGTSQAAMAREFVEETGIETAVDQWSMYGAHTKPGVYHMELFSTTLSFEQMGTMKQTTEEEPVWYQLSQIGDLVDDLGMERAVPGVAMYILTALNHKGRPFFTTTLES